MDVPKTMFVIVVFAATSFLQHAVGQVTPQSPKVVPADRTDTHGDPLPSGVALRLGTVRLRQEQGANGLAFSPDGQYLVSVGWDRWVRFWDAANGRPVRQLEHPLRGGSFGVTFSPDGRHLATVGEKGDLCVWDVPTGQLQFHRVGHKERDFGVRVFGVAFSPDSTMVATAGNDPIARIWDVASGTQLLELEDGGGSDSHAVAFARDGALLATGSGKQDSEIRIWDLQLGSSPRIIQLKGVHDLTSLVFSPDGRQLISGGRVMNKGATFTSPIRIWGVAKGDEVGEFLSTDEQLRGACSIALSADGHRLVSAHHEQVVVWDVPNRKMLKVIRLGTSQHGGRTHGIAISPDGERVAFTAFGDHAIHLFDLQTGKRVNDDSEVHMSSVLSAQFSRDGQQMITGSADRTVRLWDLASAKQIRLICNGTGWITHVTYFPDGDKILVCAEARTQDRTGIHGEVKVYRIADGQMLHQIPLAGRVTTGVVSSDGRLFAAASGVSRKFNQPHSDEPPDVRIYVWDSATSKLLGEWIAGDAWIETLRFTARENEIEGVDESGIVKSWEVASGQAIIRAQPSTEPAASRTVKSVLAARGNFLIRGRVNRDNTFGEVVTSSTQDGKEAWRQQYPEQYPTLLNTSLDGQLLAISLLPLSTSPVKPRILVYSIADGRELWSTELEDGRVRSLAFSPDNGRLTSGMDLGDTLIWDLPTNVKEKTAPR